MFISHIQEVANFNSIPDWKYENCITREEHEMHVAEKREEDGRNSRANGPCWIDSGKLLHGNELFAGDKIIGYYSDGEISGLCLYEWKRNNPRSIKAYSLLLPLEEGVLIDGDIQMIVARNLSDLEIFQKKRKILLTI